jgi:hypothetical protein
VAIRIDVHPAGKKPDQHATCFPRSVRVWSKTIRISRGPHLATFCETLTGLDRSHYSWEKGLPTQSTARRLADSWVRTQFLSWANQWSRGRKPGSCRWPTTKLIGPISPACDRYVQYLLAGANPSVLNRHMWGLQSLRCWLATYHSPIFPISCLHFPLRALSGLQFNQVPSTKPKFWMWRTYDCHVIFRPPSHLP